MEQTAVIANLPNLEIRVIHRDLPHEGAEAIAIQLKAKPSFEALANSMAVNMPPLPWMMPLQMWAALAGKAWEPWLALAFAPFGGLIATVPPSRTKK